MFFSLQFLFYLFISMHTIILIQLYYFKVDRKNQEKKQLLTDKKVLQN